MLEFIYLGFFLLGILGLAGYKAPNFISYVVFGLLSILCFVASLFFISNLKSEYGFRLGGNFLFEPSFLITPLGGFFSFIIVFIGFGASLYSLGYIKNMKRESNLSVFAALFSFFILTMLLVVSSNNVFGFIVLWEIMTLLSVLLLKFSDEPGSNKTVMIYLGIAQVGAFCIIIALLMLSYFANSSEFSGWVNLQIPQTAALIILIILFIGFGSKAGVFPLHVHSPLAYPLAKSNISALMSGVMSKIAIFGLIKFSLMLQILPGFALSVIIFGAISAILGISYALVQTQYKKLIAYSSVENIGIILLGVGVGFYGVSINEPTLILLGFVGGLFHTLNHSVFKSLLFFGAGDIHLATGQKDMTNLGGLAKKMPLSAFFILIACISISALPPLNGFVSEWFIYRSMLFGGLDESLLARAIFSLSIVALAITGALVVYAFIRLYGSIFCGVCKNENIDIKKRSLFISFAMGILAISCIYLGIASNNILGMLTSVVLSLVPNTDLSVNINTISLPLIALLLCMLFILPFILYGLFGANMSRARESEPWACGFKFSPQMSMNSNSFVGDFKRLFGKLFKFKPEFSQNSYFEPAVYKNDTKDFWWDLLYEPIIKFNAFIADKIGVFQNGRSNFYVVYILIYLYAMLVAGFYFLGA
ncbi:proton-conducting transporter membrane subunit [Campylobacter hyointestinalis]|uniref:proton-conducting transporter transmembrane domain-containing protein n=1 Tax=Campylobacter hyointestinalis TaxID=198 RepID=UPI0007266309|nr:proton-conducting transporter membrane subunit [Campylobacter hyointestinalis]CUU67926.1 hydrogenase 4 membrane subunit [Campylobacter hyointestinalis subsp. hyointestinalis]CUU85930.1 hydrogenase 4 membrane subunit [Campylobacter hyointestinalis subsp. hyointestinalis]